MTATWGRRMAALLLSVVVSLGLLSGLAPGTAQAYTGPYVRNCDGDVSTHVRAVRPASMPMICIYYRTDGFIYAHDVISAITWSSWGYDTAYARGTMSGEVGSLRVRIKLYDAHTHTSSGRRYYRKMRLYYPDISRTEYYRLYH